MGLPEKREDQDQSRDGEADAQAMGKGCGSGNFLYVALELMKRLEGEVSAFLAEFGEDQDTLGLAGHTVDPHQFLGIEVSPWAAAVAEIVLWIGYRVSDIEAFEQEVIQSTADQRIVAL